MLEKFKTEFLPPLPGGLLKWVNLVIFFLKADSISIRVSIQDTKKTKKMRLIPDTRNIKFWKSSFEFINSAFGPH